MTATGALPRRALCNDCLSSQLMDRTMTTQQLICTYLQLRGELAAALAAEVWETCRLGHIERVSRELAGVEHTLEAEETTPSTTPWSQAVWALLS